MKDEPTTPAAPLPTAPLPEAVAVLVRHAERVLLIQRANHLPLGGYWTPVTGRLEPGETHADAAHREVREEVGLAIDLGPELHRAPTSNGLFMLTYFTATLSPPTQPTPTNDPTEVAEARWLTASDIATLEPMLPTTRAILGRLLG